MPKALRPAMLPLNKGDDRVYMRNGRILACKWDDTKRLTMLSSTHGSVCVQKQIRAKHSDRGYRDINRPVCVDRCNAFLGGVDAADQRMKTYLFPHHSRKWYNRIFNAILGISMVNAHIIYCQCTAAPHKTLKVCAGCHNCTTRGLLQERKEKGVKAFSGGRRNATETYRASLATQC